MAMNYWEQELAGIKTAGSEDVVRLKLVSSCSETKWLSLKPEEYEAIEAFLVELYSKRIQAEEQEEKETAAYDARLAEWQADRREGI